MRDASLREIVIYSVGLFREDGFNGEYLANLMRVCNKEYEDMYGSGATAHAHSGVAISLVLVLLSLMAS